MNTWPPPDTEPETRPGVPKVWYWIGAGFAALIAYALITNGTGNEKSLTPSEAFCADLRNGHTLMNLWPRDQDPADYAGDAYGRVSISCPEFLERNRSYFEGWGYTVD